VTSIVPLVLEAGCEAAFAGGAFDCERVDAAPFTLAALATLLFRRLLFARSAVAQAVSIAKLPDRNNTIKSCEFVFKGCVSRSRVLGLTEYQAYNTNSRRDKVTSLVNGTVSVDT